ncbi:HD domain-containing protein [Nostoc commune]|uniref:HD domain-containing protein n=1 Tax=Nostoc commune TaxID=1178 RepID=UPI002ED91FAD
METRQHSQALFNWYAETSPCRFARIIEIITYSPKSSKSQPQSEIQVQSNRLTQQIQFIIEIDRLKHVMRQTLLIDGSRRENSAEHSWHLAVISCPVEYLLNPKNPTPPKLCFVSPPRRRGGAGGGVQ